MMHFTVVNDGASTGSPLRTLEHKLPGAAPQGRAVLEAVALSPQDLELRADFAEACLTAAHFDEAQRTAEELLQSVQHHEGLSEDSRVSRCAASG
jgi:hypothetical protein